MKIIQLIVLLSAIFFYSLANGQNTNISQNNQFDGEPYITVNPTNDQHIAIAWMGYVFGQKFMIHTRVSIDGGRSWSTSQTIPHANTTYSSPDPCLQFDNNGNLYLSFIDFNTSIDSGEVYVTKSVDGGNTWGIPKSVIKMHSDSGKRAIDRPWMSVDKSNTSFNGNVYITTMNLGVGLPVNPPYHPYFMRSTNNGASYTHYRYLDTTGYLSGSLLPLPMATHTVALNGVFYAIYPSWVFSQALQPQFILAKSLDGGNTFSHAFIGNFDSYSSNSSDAKKGYKINANPSDSNHLVITYLSDKVHGDLDVFIIESMDAGLTWTTPARVNDDPIANNRMQDMVWTDFDEDGDLFILWRDRRNGSDSTFKTASEIWGAYKNKDSLSFASNFMISDTTYLYDSILTSAGNDFLCVDIINDTIHATWGDARSGKIEVWYEKLTIGGQTISVSKISRKSLNIYPNPAQNLLFIDEIQNENFKIYNPEGQLLLEGISRNKQIDISTLKKGYYYLTIDSFKVKQFIKH